MKDSDDRRCPEKDKQMSALSVERLRAAADRLSRISLAHLPTPLEEAPRFARQVRGPCVFIKRDGCTGLLVGGPKTRHNGFLLAEALRQGADVVAFVHTGGTPAVFASRDELMGAVHLA